MKTKLANCFTLCDVDSNGPWSAKVISTKCSAAKICNVLLGGGVRVRVRVKVQREIKGTTKPLMAILDNT